MKIYRVCMTKLHTNWCRTIKYCKSKEEAICEANNLRLKARKSIFTKDRLFIVKEEIIKDDRKK